MRNLYRVIFLLLFFFGKSFSANYNMGNGTQNITCGVAHNFYDSGGSGGSYANSVSYTLTFVPATAGQCVNITFSSFNTESCCDFITIYDGNSTAGTVLGTYSGATIPPSITSTSGAITIKFTSDGSVVAAGWAAVVQCTTCPPPPPPSYNMNNTNVTLTCPSSFLFYDSGGGSGNYANSENYTKTFTAPAGSCLQFAFSSFGTESCCDRLKIFDGPNGSSPIIGTYSGTAGPGTIQSTGTSVTFSFTSDGSVVSSGWTATITCVSACTGTPNGGTAAATPTAACAAGGTVALSVTGSAAACGLTYQWQSAPVSAGPWTNIAGATTATVAGTVPGNVCFRRLTRCGVNTGTSTPVCITVGACTSQLGSGVVSVGSLPYSTSGTTCGSGNDITSANAVTTGCSSSSYYSGEDQVFVFTPTTSGNITISLTSGGTYTGLMLYNTCPMSCAGGSGCVGSATGSSGNKTLVACVTAGTTYYLILDSFAAPTCNAYSNLSISAPGAVSASSNDACAAPTPLSATGSFSANTNVYTADTPGNLTSVFCGSIENNQWFSFTATSTSASFSVSGVGGAACGAGVQAQVFSVSTTTGVCSSCNSFTSVSTPCYNPGNFTSGSVTATGLTVGQTYYLMVDGNAGAQCNFTIGGWSLAPLPVVLMSFTGEAYSTEINKLNWKVAQEKNLDRYLIQKSNDATNYFTIGELKAYNNNSQSSYEFYDKKAERGLSYYRLQIVEKSGAYNFSRAIALDNNPEAVFSINKVFPNPANSVIYASVQTPSEGSVLVEITDITGRVLYSVEQAVNAGTNLIKADLENYKKGIYYLNLSYNKEIKVEKFILN
jgi:hypothetical protein